MPQSVVRDKVVTLFIFSERDFRSLLKRAPSVQYSVGDEFRVVVPQSEAPIARNVSDALTPPARTFEVVNIKRDYIYVMFHDSPFSTCPVETKLFDQLVQALDVELERPVAL